MKMTKMGFVVTMILGAAAPTGYASSLEAAPDEIALECSSPKIGKIRADLNLDIGYYYQGMVVHFDAKGDFVDAFRMRQENNGSLGAVYGDGRIWLSIPPTGEPDWNAHDADCVAPVAHPGATVSISLEDPSQSRIELIKGAAWNPRIQTVYKNSGWGWPIVQRILDGRVCEEATDEAVDLPLTCAIR